MGSCVSSQEGTGRQWNPHLASMEEETPMKMTESKGLKRATPYMRGAATSFGFRRPHKSSSKHNEIATLEDVGDAQTESQAAQAAGDSNKDVVGVTGRLNRFGFRSASSANTNNGSGVAGRGGGVTNKVADSSSKKQRPNVFLVDSKRPAPKVLAKPAAAASPSPVVSLGPGGGGPRGPGAPRCSPRASISKEGPRPTPPCSIPGLKPVKGPVSHLPRPQLVNRNATRDVRSAKSATIYSARGFAPIATFDEEIGSSKESSLNEDSGLGSQMTGDTDTLHGVEVLDISPRSAAAQKARRGVSGAHIHSLKEDEDDPHVITEILPIPLPNKKSPAGRGLSGVSPVKAMGLQPRGSIKSAKSASSDEFHYDLDLARDYGEGLDDREDRSEEKVYRDHRAPEKLFLGGRCMKDYGPDGEQDDDWGHGEAMAEKEWKEGLSVAVIDDVVDTEGMKHLLSTEGKNLAELVASSSEHGLIEDESAPEDSLFSSSPPSTSEDSPTAAKDKTAKRKVRTKKRCTSKEKESSPKERTNSKDEPKTASATEKKDEHLLSPEGSGTPSNSFSLSDGRDFLIDDEIGDQPALTIQNRLHGDDCDLELPSLTESTASLTICDSSRKQVPESRASKAPSEATVTESPRSRNRDCRELERDASIDTLSPCASIASDDLIMDFECSTLEDNERQLRSLDAVVPSEMDNGDVLREWSSLIDSFHKDKDREIGVAAPGRSRLLRSRASLSSGNSSVPDSPSPRSAPSPLRPPRQLASSDSDESAMMKVDRGLYQHMYQDVVHIKTMLLKLKRVLQEAETLNPFESSLKNGFLHQLVHADGSEDEDARSRDPQEEVVDLKRQMVLMKQQMEEKDRTIQLMQVQMMKYERVSEDTSDGDHIVDTCNAATQTERVRPVSAGPSLLQSLPCDPSGTPLVSWTDTWGRRSRTPAGGGSGSVASSSKVPTATVRNSRSAIPGHQRCSLGASGETPSNIPLVKSCSRKTGNSSDSVPNARRPPAVAVAEKSYSNRNM